MPKFSYTVINTEGQTLNGVIDASDESSAREELNKMEFSVLEVIPMSEEEEKAVVEDIIKYEFEGVDKTNRKVKGTIDAVDKYSAFKRLIKEYNIEVAALYKGAGSLEEKDAEKEKGVVDFYTQFKKEKAGSDKESKKTLHETEETEKKLINEQIEFVLKKIEELLRNFSEILKPEEITIIEKKRDKLLRMKTSANLPYLGHLCEELLNYIQNQEIYAAQKSNDERVQKFNMEIKQMLGDIQRGKASKDLRTQLIESIKKWREDNITDVPHPSAINNIINKILTVIEEWIEEDPRITDAKNRLKFTKQRIKDYQKIYKKEISDEYRKEMYETIKKLQLEAERIGDEIRKIKYAAKSEMISAGEESLPNKIIKEFMMLTGFLLAFYLIFYIVSEYLFTKNLGIDPSNYIFSVEKSIQFHYIVAILFVTNAVLSIKYFFFRKNLAGTILALPLILILSILIIFNF